MSFQNLKRNRGNDLAKLQKEVEKTASGGGGFEKDERYWSPTVDKAGNGTAVVRFLPGAEGDDIPYIQLWTHAFKGPGGWYIENSRTTLSQSEKDPCGEYNSELWNSVTDEEDPKNESPARKQAKAQKRKLNYISNVYIVKDPGNPANEGKVFMYKYGKKIFEKINNKMNPPEEDIKPMNPFDMWEGANFRLRIRKVDGNRNYDTSEFDTPSELLDGDDAELEKVYNAQHSLKATVAPDQFKSYDELKKRLYKVLKLDEDGREVGGPAAADEDNAPKAEKPAEPKARKAAEPRTAAPADEEDPDEDAGMAFFQRIANEDED